MKLSQQVLQALKKTGLFKHTEFIILYGSVNTGKQNPLSDIDICISLSLSPSARLKARIKLLSILSEKFDLQIFEDLPLFVQKSVLGGKLLYCKNLSRTAERAITLLKEYEDFEPVYLSYIHSRGALAET